MVLEGHCPVRTALLQQFCVGGYGAWLACHMLVIHCLSLVRTARYCLAAAIWLFLVAGRVEIACHYTVSPSVCLLFQVAGALSCPKVVPGDIAPLGDPGDAVVLVGLRLLPPIQALLILCLSRVWARSSPPITHCHHVRCLSQQLHLLVMCLLSCCSCFGIRSVWRWLLLLPVLWCHLSLFPKCPYIQPPLYLVQWYRCPRLLVECRPLLSLVSHFQSHYLQEHPQVWSNYYAGVMQRPIVSVSGPWGASHLFSMHGSRSIGLLMFRHLFLFVNSGFLGGRLC